MHTPLNHINQCELQCREYTSAHWLMSGKNPFEIEIGMFLVKHVYGSQSRKQFIYPLLQVHTVFSVIIEPTFPNPN